MSGKHLLTMHSAMTGWNLLRMRTVNIIACHIGTTLVRASLQDAQENLQLSLSIAW
jgi:hypothetical protein